MISFSPDSGSIIFSGINPAGLLQLKNTPGIDTAYSTVISVLELPNEKDSTSFERSLPGHLSISDSTVVFSPRNAFIKGKNYQVVSFLNARFGDAGMMLTGKLDHKLKPSQIILRR